MLLVSKRLSMIKPHLLFVLITGWTLIFANTTEGQSLQLNGSSQYVTVPHSADLTLASADFTIEAWVKVNAISGFQTILAKGGGNYAENTAYFMSITSGGNVGLYLSNGSTSTLHSSGSSISAGQWHHVAVTFDHSSSVVRFFIDGVFDGSRSYSFTAAIGSETEPMYIGQQGYDCQCNLFNGAIDELRIWSILRTDDEILSSSKLDPPIDNASMEAYYDFNEGSGTVLNDLTSANRDGTLVGSPTWNGAGAPEVSFSSALYFAGNDGARVTGFSDGGTGALTIEAWIKLKEVIYGGYQTIVDFDGDNPFFGFQSGNIIAYNSGILASASFTNYVDKLTHVAITLSNGSQKIYINGSEVASGSGSYTGSNTAFGIGYNNSDTPFKGTIGEVRIWNDVRSSNEIAANFAADLNGNEANLRAFYDFSEGAGTTLNDGTANNYDATTFIGNPTWVPSMDAIPPVFASTIGYTVLENTTGVVADFNAAIDNGGNDVGISYSVSGTDASFFSINSANGLLSLNQGIDYEEPEDADNNNLFEVVVSATGNGIVASTNYTVSITDVDECEIDNIPGTSGNHNTDNYISHQTFVACTSGKLSRLEILEIFGGANGTIKINEVTDYVEGTPTGATLESINAASATWKDAYPYSTGGYPYDYDAKSVITFSGAIVYEGLTYVIDLSELNGVRYVYGDDDYAGGQTYVLGSPVPSRDMLFELTINPKVNIAPIFYSEATASFEENATGVILDVNAKDESESASKGTADDLNITYSISGTDGALFAIDAATGELTFLSPPDFENKLDNNGDGVYEIIVTANDGLTTNQNVTITVTDVDEAPIFSSANTADFLEGSLAVIIDVDATSSGQSADVGITYSISSGSDAALFSIDESTGEVSATIALDFEFPSDANTNNVYEIVVTATSSIGSEDQQISLTVIDNSEEIPLQTYNALVDGFSLLVDVPEDATDILIDVSDVLSFTNFIVDNESIGISGSAEIDVSLEEGTTYYYRAKAVVGGQESVYSYSLPFMINAGNALHFDGSNDYVSVPSSSDLYLTNALTIEVWIKADNASSNEYIIEKLNSQNGWAIRQQSNGGISLLTRKNGSLTHFFGPSVVPSVNQWHHLAVTYDDATNSGYMYVNGELVASNTNMTAGIGANSNAMHLASDINSISPGNFDGQLDEVRIWSVARTQAEIQTTLNESLIGNENNLIAYYRFDQPSGNVLQDLTANAHNGSLIGMAGTEWTLAPSGTILTESLGAASLEVGESYNYTVTTNLPISVSNLPSWLNATGDNTTSLSISGTPQNEDIGNHTFDINISARASYSKSVDVAVEMYDGPSAIALSNMSVDEFEPAGELVGTLTTTDPDVNDTFTYSLVAGDGDTDNASFMIDGDELKTAVELTEDDSPLSVKVQTEDFEGNLFAQSFSITVNDNPQQPYIISIVDQSIDEDAAASIPISLGDKDGIYSVEVTSGILSLLDYGAGNISAFSSSSSFRGGFDFAIAPNEDIYLIVYLGSSNPIYKITSNGTVTTYATGVPQPAGIEYGDDGYLYLALPSSQRIARISSDGTLNYFVGDGTATSVDGTLASAKIRYPKDVKKGPDGMIYFLEEHNGSIRKIDEANDLVSTVYSFGSSVRGFDIDQDGSFVVTKGHAIYRVAADGSSASVIAGAEESGNSNGPVASARFNQPWFPEIGTNGDIFFVDNNEPTHNRVKKISNGIVSDFITAYDADGGEFSLEQFYTNYVPSMSYFSIIRATPTGYVYFNSSTGSEGSFFKMNTGQYLIGTPDNDDVGTATVTVEVTDNDNNVVSESFELTVNNTNDAPTGISLSTTILNENESIGTEIAIISTDDVDPPGYDSHSYALVSGAGDTHNGNFEIEYNYLKPLVVFDAEDPGTSLTQSIRLESTDATGLKVEAALEITIRDLDEFTASSGTPDWNDPSSWESGEVPGKDDDISLPENITISIDDIQAVKNLLVQVNTVIEISNGGALAIFGEYSGEGEVEQTREITGTASGGYSIVGSPMTTTPDVSALPIVVFEYDGAVGFKRKKTGALEPGRGYFLRESNPDGISLDLALGGEPNTGDVSVDISTAGDGFNLLANPYTAAISVVDFIDANDDIEGTLYLWDDGGENSGGTRGGDYIAVNKMGLAGVINNGGYSGNTGSGSFDMNIGSVQGFFAKALIDGEVVFSQSMQVTTSASNAVFFRVANAPEEELPQTIKLKLSNGELSNMLLLGLASGASVDKDRGYDSEKFVGNSEISFYSKRDEYKYAIEGLGRIEEGEEAMFNLSYDLSLAGQYELTLEETMNLPAEMDIILYDKVEDKEYNLRNTKGVSFVTSEGQDIERFTLIFRLKAKPLNTATAPYLSLYGSANTLNILYPSNKDEQVRIVTLDGKEVVKEVAHFDNGKTTMDVQLKPKQLYVLIIQNESIKFIITE